MTPTAGGRPPSRNPRDLWIRQLQAWMKEWEADRALAAPAEPALCLPPVLRYDVRVRPGEIWLLHPSAPALPERPIYMAVLFIHHDDSVRVAPFSRFQSPAFEGEWPTGRSDGPLRVLGLGFQRLVPMRALASGWRAGRMTVAERKAVNGWLESAAGEEPAHPALRGRCGPPLVHPDDPRWDYVREEIAWLDAWAASTAESSDAVREESGPLLKAAEPRAIEDTYRTRPRPRPRDNPKG